MVFNTKKMLQRSKGKTAEGILLKKYTFVNKNESFYLQILQQILGVNKKVNSVTVLAKLGQLPLSINIETRCFMLQGFPFIDKDRYLHKVFQEQNLDTAEWIRNIKTILEFYGQGNFIQKIFKIIV